MTEQEGKERTSKIELILIHLGNLHAKLERLEKRVEKIEKNHSTLHT